MVEITHTKGQPGTLPLVPCKDIEGMIFIFCKPLALANLLKSYIKTFVSTWVNLTFEFLIDSYRSFYFVECRSVLESAKIQFLLLSLAFLSMNLDNTLTFRATRFSAAVLHTKWPILVLLNDVKIRHPTHKQIRKKTPQACT